MMTMANFLHSHADCKDAGRRPERIVEVDSTTSGANLLNLFPEIHHDGDELRSGCSEPRIPRPRCLRMRLPRESVSVVFEVAYVNLTEAGNKEFGLETGKSQCRGHICPLHLVSI